MPPTPRALGGCKAKMIKSVRGFKIGDFFESDGVIFKATEFPTRYSVCGVNPNQKLGEPNGCKVSIRSVVHLTPIKISQMSWEDKVIEQYKEAGVEVIAGFSCPEGVGKIPTTCPICEQAMIQGEMLGSGDCEMDIINYCPNDNHPAIWYTGESYPIT